MHEPTICPYLKREEQTMPKHYYPIALLALALCLSACSGNYKFSDDDYRPLGDPQAETRGN